MQPHTNNTFTHKHTMAGKRKQQKQQKVNLAASPANTQLVQKSPPVVKNKQKRKNKSKNGSHPFRDGSQISACSRAVLAGLWQPSTKHSYQAFVPGEENVLAQAYSTSNTTVGSNRELQFTLVDYFDLEHDLPGRAAVRGIYQYAFDQNSAVLAVNEDVPMASKDNFTRVIRAA